jgi:hypothetical protein
MNSQFDGENFPYVFKSGLRPPREPLRRPSALCRFAPGAGHRDTGGHDETPATSYRGWPGLATCQPSALA